MGEKGDRPDGRQDDRARRLAEALRENLRRRKAQARARSPESHESGRSEPPENDES